MANFIRKLATYTFIPGTPGTVSDPGQPFIPAYCSWVTIAGGYEAEVQPDGSVIITFVEPHEEFICFPEQQYIAPTPGVEPTPGQTITNNNLGWNSGAESVVVFDVNSIYQMFPNEASVGIVTGITSSTLVPGYGYLLIEFGFLFDHGTARVIEKGVLVTDRVTFTEGDKFGIAIVDGFVRYFHNDVFVHESAKDPENLPLKVDLSFYAAGDQLNNASVTGVIVQETTTSSMKTRTLHAGAVITGSVTSSTTTSGSAISSDTNLIESNMATSETAAGLKIITLPATTSGETFRTVKAIGDFHYATSSTAFEPLETLASDKPYAESTNTFQALVTEIGSSNYTPSFAIAAGAFVPLVGTSHGLTGQVSVSSDMVFEPLDGLSSDHPYGEAETSFEPLTGSGREDVEFDGFLGFGEIMGLTAYGGPADQARAILTAPKMTLTAHGGGHANLSMPAMQLTIQGTLEGVGRLNAIMPSAVLTASGITGALGTANLFMPRMTLTAFSGAGAVMTAPRPYTLTASGLLGAVGTATLTAPTMLLTASGTASSVGTATMTAPMPFMMYGIAELTTPTLTLVGTDVVAGTVQHVFAVNMKHGEATEYLNYPASFLGTLAGRQLMIDSSGINEIGGTKDDTALIDWFVEFHASDFGASNLKRLPVLYLAGEGDAELVVTARTGDGNGGENESDNRYHVGAGTRRVKLGRGTKARYWGIKIESASGGSGSIAGVEYLFNVLERKR